MQRLLALFLALAFVTAPTLADVAHAQGDWGAKRDPFDRKIIARYKGILKRNPGDKSARRKLVQLYKRYRSVGLLIREYEKTVAARPNDYAAHVVLGHLQLSKGNSDGALQHFQKAVAIKPKSSAVQLALGDLYRQTGQLDHAKSAYEAALKHTRRNKQKKPVLRALADLALGKGDIEGARKYYDDYFAIAPKDIQARVSFGDALMLAGKNLEAADVFAGAEAKLRNDPARLVEIMTRKGAAYEAAGQEDTAIREYRKAIAKVGRSYYLRKDLTERIIDIHRRRQALGDLVLEFEKKWPEKRRQHFEWDTLARLYDATGAQEKAIKAFRKATKKAPYELDTQRSLITLLKNSGRDDELLKQYENVIRVAPGEPRFQKELAELYWQRSMDKKALALLGKMEARFPGDAGVHVAAAQLYDRWGKPDKALAAYKRLTRIEPGDITHLINLGEQYFQRNQKKQAEAVWKKIVARKTPANYAKLGEVYAEHDMLQPALQNYAKAIKLEPKNASHFKGRARVHERRRAFQDAVRDWQKVLALTPRKSVNRPARREARRRVVGLLKRARGGYLLRQVRKWSRAFANDPPDIDAGYFLVENHLRERSHDKARDVLVRLLKIDPGDIEAMELLVKVYKRGMQYDKAVELLIRLAEKAPSRKREFYSEIAEIKTDQTRDSEAIEWMNKAVLSSPKDPVAHLRLAERYAQMQQLDKAIEAYEKTIELDKRNFRAYFALAQLYTNLDQPQKTAELYREVLRRASEEELLRKAGRKAISLEELTGTLGELERVLVPLAFTFSHKPVYRRVLVELYRRYVPHLVAQWRKGDANARTELDRLGSHGLKPLLEALGDEEDPQQQGIAVDVLGYLGNPGAAAPLVRLAEKTVTPDLNRRRHIGTLRPTLQTNVRVRALIAAGRLSDPRIVGSLVALSRHREKNLRAGALFALGETGSAKAVPALLEALRTQKHKMRAIACLGLSRIPAAGKDPKAVAAMTRILENHRNADRARAACAYALANLGIVRSVPTLIAALRHGNGETQRLTAWALGRLGAKQAIPALARAYFSRHTDVRDWVAWALAKAASGRQSAPPPANIGAHAYPHSQTNYDLRAVLSALPGPAPSETGTQPSPTILLGHRREVIAGLQDALGRHRDLLIRVLRELDEPRAHLGLGIITNGIADLPASETRRVHKELSAIAAALTPRLVELLDHRDRQVRTMTVSVLAKVDSAESRAALVKTMDDESPSVWTAALEAAARHAAQHPHGAAEMARAVAARLSDKDWQKRAKAARVVGAFAQHADRVALRKGLTDEHAFVRANAAHSLGELRDSAAIDGLIAATADKYRSVAESAVRALAAIGGSKAYAHLQTISRDQRDPDLAELAGQLASGIKN